MPRKHAYRVRQGNANELLELIAGSSMPTGRVFRKARDNEDLSFKETVTLKDAATNIYTTYIFSHIE